MSGTYGRILGSALVVDWSQFEGTAALRCTLGVAVPLVVGLAIGQPAVGVFGAIGAVSVGFGSFQGAYRSRAAVMLFAAAGMALSIFFGSIAGHHDATAIAAAALWGFGGGFIVALGPSASFVGLQSVVAVLLAGGFPADLRLSAGRAALVLGGGLVQTLLVVMIWPLRRFSAERRSLAVAYRSLASYAAAIPAGVEAAPEPHTFAGTPSPLEDPQPFAKSGDVLVFQALLDEGERIRASLASLATQYRRLSEGDQSCASTMSAMLRRALAEIADALDEGREPREAPGLWATLDRCALQFSHATAVEALLGQLRAAWRTAGVLTAASSRDDLAPRVTRVVPLRRRPPVRDALITLRANLTLDSTACRHALRLSASLVIATAIYRLLELPRGYWIPLTALLVLKPEFHDTFARGIARIAGTLLGAGFATLIAHTVSPGPHGLTALVLGFVWSGYALVRTSYALFTVCITGYVVFLLMLAGVPELTAVTYRIVYTAEGGVLALCIYALWPTWTAVEVRPALAGLLEAHRGYVEALLEAYADPRRTDLHALGEIRDAGRLTRSNAEATVERMLAEPAVRHSIPAKIALGLLAAIRRHALAGLALHAGLERGVPEPVPAIEELSRQMSMSLSALAAALRSGAPPPPLPPLRQTQLALNTATNDLVRDETDLMVDSLNTMASLLAKDAKARGVQVTAES
jgi:Fusaric acid resistance protein-like